MQHLQERNPYINWKLTVYFVDVYAEKGLFLHLTLQIYPQAYIDK